MVPFVSILTKGFNFVSNYKQPSRGFLRKSCSENIQHITGEHPRLAIQSYWNHNSARVFSRKFTVFFQKPFHKNTFWGCNRWIALRVISSREHLSQVLTIAKLQLPVSRIQKQPSSGGLRKRFSENIEQIYRRTPTPKCDFNKSYFGMGVLLYICCIFSEHLSMRTRMEGCFCRILSCTNLEFRLCWNKLC